MATLAPCLDLGMCVRAESEQNGGDLQCEGWCHLNTSLDKMRAIVRRYLALSICAFCLTRVSLLAPQAVGVTQTRKFAPPNGATKSIKSPLGPH
ncbi:hypothetical protein QQF64_017266 [Cirrhinus molitorella]|uniref:Uncharacterized protein n=2 Tax=Cirrhinus molitorella TaxID=172907 RepID=A0ABR3LM68_9TELE|nr:hypothetical protein Q8A67_022896 [Cirrhinus molitorella]